MSRSLVARLGAWPSLLALILTATPTVAQTNYFWNAPDGGSGHWDAATIWNATAGGATDYTWLNNGNERANLGDTAGTVTVAAGGNTAFGLNFTTGGYLIDGGTLTLAGTGGPVGVSTGTATIDAALAGTVGLTKTGSGTLVLGGTNTYTGVTTVNAGVLVVTNGSALGATGTGNNTTVASGAALQVGGAITVTEAITLSGNGISDTGALRKTGSDTTTWTGGLTIAGGGARIHADAGTLDIRPSASVIAASGQTLTFSGSGNITIGGNGNLLQLGTGTLNKEGPGVLTIENSNGPSTFDGPVNVTGGVLSVGVSTALGLNGVITLNGGTLRNTTATTGVSFISASHPIVIGSNGGTVDVANAGSALLYGPIGTVTISGTGNTLTKTGPGEFRYRNAGTALSTFSRLVVNQGLFRLGSVVSNGVEQTAETGFGAVPAGFLADAITLNGGGIGVSFNLSLHANRGITVGPNGGTIYGSFGTEGAPITILGAISGSGPLTVSPGTQQVTFSGANTNSGTTTVNAGTLALGAANVLSPNSALTLNGGANLVLNNRNQVIASLAGAGNVSLGTGTLTTGGNNTSTTYSGVMSGAGGSLVKQGAGTLTLGGANTYLGGTTVTGGTLQIGAANALPTTGAVTLNGGTLGTGATTGFDQTAGGLSVSDSSTIALGAGAHTLTFSSFGTLGAGETLTITGWVGDPGVSGTGGRIVIANTSGLTPAVLAGISFTGDPDFGSGAMMLGNELVPVPVPEPSTVTAVAAAGLGAVGLVRRHRLRQRPRGNTWPPKLSCSRCVTPAGRSASGPPPADTSPRRCETATGSPSRRERLGSPGWWCGRS